MAAKTRTLAKSGACVAVLNYDDATLLATGVTVANVGGHEPVTFFVVLNGTPLSVTVAIGQTSVLTFTSAAAVTLGTAANGNPNIIVAGLTGYGIGNT